jgi:hypothetical protein
MYVEDMTLADAYATRRSLQKIIDERKAGGWPRCEQTEWDLEDVEARIFILTA